VLTQRIFATFDSDDASLALPDLCRRLIEQQTRVWPMLSGGRAALANVEVRRVTCAGFDVELQYNPRRITSTSARVDPASLKARRCFLCPEHLPSEQQGILYRDHFLILCNPAPIFDGHLTISSVVHEPQVLRPWLPAFLALAADLSPVYTVLYNGPRCGASAPDHLHFQAAPAGKIPAERDLAVSDRLSAPITVSRASVARAIGYGREAIVVMGSSPEMLVHTLTTLLATLPRVAGDVDEPMVNVMAAFGDGAYRILIFPRRKHRPSAYFIEGDGQVTVSPAVVDMGGLIITPVEKDFNTLTAAFVEEMYREVSSDGKEVQDLFTRIAGKAGG
jgi:hypothetical protein